VQPSVFAFVYVYYDLTRGSRLGVYNERKYASTAGHCFLVNAVSNQIPRSPSATAEPSLPKTIAHPSRGVPIGAAYPPTNVTRPVLADFPPASLELFEPASSTSAPEKSSAVAGSGFLEHQFVTKADRPGTDTICLRSFALRSSPTTA